MGLEADCSARIGGRSVLGKARLEDKDLIFRGAERLTIPLTAVTSATAKAGRLLVRYSGGSASFELGKAAEKWALKLRYPKSRIDKLGVKPGLRVAVVGVDEAEFLKELRGRTADVSLAKPKAGSDLVFVAMSDRKDLARLAALRKAIKPEGAIWVVWPKGRKEFREDDVRAAGPGAGLVDVKVVAFSETLSGLKMMIPVALRPKKSR
jgi:hypothetical protein